LISLTLSHSTPSLQLSVIVVDYFGRLSYTPRGTAFRTVFVRTALLNSQNSVRLTAVESDVFDYSNSRCRLWLSTRLHRLSSLSIGARVVCDINRLTHCLIRCHVSEKQ